MIKDEQEAVELWKNEIDNILNKREVDWQIIFELEANWSEAVSPYVAKLQENIAKWAVENNIVSKEEANEALARRFNGKIEEDP